MSRSGELVSEAATKIGHDGVVTVEESSTLNLGWRSTEGVGFDKGLHLGPASSPTSDLRKRCSGRRGAAAPRQISSLPDLPLLEKVAEAGEAAADRRRGRRGEALSTLVVNAIRKTLKAVAVKAPFFSDRRKAFLENLAIMASAQVINPRRGSGTA